MNIPKPSRQPIAIRGILSMILSTLGVLLVAYFASGAGSRVTYSRNVITFTQYLLLTLLGSGLASGIVGVARREQPRWLSLLSFVFSIFISSLVVLYFHSLDD